MDLSPHVPHKIFFINDIKHLKLMAERRGLDGPFLQVTKIIKKTNKLTELRRDAFCTEMHPTARISCVLSPGGTAFFPEM